MPKAEVGSAKYISNQMKRKGLQRLRWYCQVCEKQCPDANGFKMHTQSESHVRQMLVVGEDPKKFINDFSNQFQRDFLQLLKTGHGEKKVHINQFYQEYIANKEHIHMNATKWSSLTEFAKHLGREGICRVEENDKGIHVSWIDNSPEALRRQEALRRKEAQNQGDADTEQRMLREQIRRAQEDAGKRNLGHPSEAKLGAENRDLKLQDGDKLSLVFDMKPAKSTSDLTASLNTTPVGTESLVVDRKESCEVNDGNSVEDGAAEPSAFAGVSMKMSSKPQVKNVFARGKKSLPAGNQNKGNALAQPKKMSEAERIMKEELERKRSREPGGLNLPGTKRRRTND